MISSYGELNEKHLDVLSELGNIGAGNAATSLSAMIDGEVGVSVPSVKILSYEEAIRSVGDPESLGLAVMIRYSGEVQGIMLFLLEYEDAKGIAERMMEEAGKSDNSVGLSDMKISTIMEIGNILGSSYLGSISALTGLDLAVSVPYICIDMIGAIMSAPMLEYSVDNSRILLVDEGVSIDESCLMSHVILLADIPSLNKILSRLGIDG